MFKFQNFLDPEVNHNILSYDSNISDLQAQLFF